MNPDDYTITETFIEVGDGHQLYAQEWGNKKAKSPIIYLHGGPGSGCKDRAKRQFNPSQHRVIFFDQRGCGRSLPYGSLEHNTTDKLIEDINKIADHFGIKTFVLCGGSWGSTLALAYAITHPKRVEAIVLRGIFTASKSEIDWLEQGHFREFFPEVWEAYLEKTPKKYRHDPGSYHMERALNGDLQAQQASAFAYDNMEGAVLFLDDRPRSNDLEGYDPLPARIEMHYIKHHCFMSDRHILRNAHKLTMPVWLVQGRYDMICPPRTSYELHKELPNSQLIMTIAGHHGSDRSIEDVSRTILLQFK